MSFQSAYLRRTFAVIFTLVCGVSTSFAQYPLTPIEEVAQTSDLIFVGTATGQESYYNEQETAIFTDMYFTADQIIHSSDESAQVEQEQITVTYAGGTVGEVQLHVSESPSFELDRQYIIFKLDDGERYFNPVVAGSQGLFQVIRDQTTEEAYVLTADGRPVTDVTIDTGVQTGSRVVSSIDDGEVIYEEESSVQEYQTTTAPQPDSSAAAAVARTSDPGPAFPMSLEAFIEFIQGVALEVPVEDPVLQTGDEGTWISEEDGEIIEEELPEPNEAALGKTVDEIMQDPQLPGRADGSSISPGKTTAPAGPQKAAGQNLRACGYQNLHITMENYNPRKQKHINAMAVWNKYVDVYRYTSDDGSFGENNTNEVVGFIGDSKMQQAYDSKWGSGDLAQTLYWSKNGSCPQITEADVMYNRSVSWSDNLNSVINTKNVFSFRWTVQHELGHTWGHQDFINEAYDYDHPTVMHGGYDTKIVEDGWGIHAPDADLLRRHYSNQTGAETITDVGVESYAAKNGLDEATTSTTSGTAQTKFYPGQKVKINGMTVENMSNASKTVELTFYLSNDRTITSSDHKLNTFTWGSFGGGKYYKGDFTVKIPFSMRSNTGKYYVGAKVEVPDAQDDLSQNNTTTVYEQIEIRSALQLTGTIVDASGDPIMGVWINGLAGGISLKTDVNGEYTAAVPYNFNGTITPDHDYYTFSPSQKSFSGVTSDQTADFSGTRKTATISGHVTEASSSNAMSGVAITGLPGTVTTNSTGYYQATVEQGYDYTLTPQEAGYNFTPVSKKFIELKQDQTQDFTAKLGALSNSDWPQFRQGRAHAGALKTEPVSSAKEAWGVSAGGLIYSSPAVGASGNVYVGSYDNQLYAFDAQGNQQWTFRTNGTILTSPAIGAGEVIYVGSNDGRVYAINPDGTQQWSYNTGSAIGSSVNIGPDGTIYVGSTDGKLYALTSSGSKKWEFPTGGSVESTPAIGTDTTIYFGSKDDNVYAVNPDGTQKWTYQTGGEVTSSPAVDDNGTIYVGSTDNTLYALNASGTLKWKYSTGGSVTSSPAIGDSGGMIYVGSHDNSLYAIDSTGAKQWEFATAGEIYSSPAVHRYEIGAAGYFSGAVVEIVYVGSYDGKIYAVQGTAAAPTTPAAGTKRWEHATGREVLSSPALTDNTLYVGSYDQKLYKLEGREEVDGQIAVHGIDPDLKRKIDIAVMLAESGWFEQGAILGGGLPGADGGGCGGSGPRMIPACGGAFGRYGSISGRIDMVAGQEVLFAAIRDGYLDQVRSGENMEEGVLGEFTTTFEEGQRFFAVISGMANPEGFAPNPDGRSTDLQLFVKDDYQPVAETRETVRLFAGHFVPDGSVMEITFDGTAQTLTDLRYGDMGTGISLTPDVYQMTMVMHGSAPGKAGSAAAEKTVALDLRERGGETIALFASGFVNPEENNDGPALDLQTHTADGETRTLGEESTDIVEVADELPEQFRLEQNYPNPFNPSTAFSYALPEQTQVQLTVYNAMGEEVARLVDEQQAAGQYTVQFDASNLPSGMYIYRLETPKYRDTRKMMLVK